MRSLRPGLSGLVAAGVTVLVASLAGAGVASADPIDDQRSKVEQYADMIEALEEETARLAEEYDIALDELGQLEDDVAAAEEAVAEKAGRGRRAAGRARRRRRAGVSSTPAPSGMGIFSEPSQFSEELQRDELTRVALNSGTADSDDLEQAVSELTEQQETLEEQREAAADKTEEVADAQEAAEDQTEELHDAQAEAEAELGELIREEQERRARESWERIQAEAAAAQARAEAQAAAASQAQQQASDANPTSAGGGGGGGGNTSSGGGGNNPSSGGGGGGGGTGAPAAPPQPAAPIPQASSRAGTAVNAAASQVGVGYRYAAASPGVAFDCSGLTSWAWGQAGVYLPHQSAQQYASVPHVPSSAAQPGDLIFFYSPISHVGIYIGGGMMIDAASPSSGVRRAAINWGNVTGVGRPS